MNKVLKNKLSTETVAKKTSTVTWVKRIFAVFSVVWIATVVCAPLYVKNHYETPIKQSLVVSLFYDLQRDIAETYSDAMNKLRDAIDVSAPISNAFDAVMLSESVTTKVADTTAAAQETVSTAQKVSGFASMFGIDTSKVEEVVAKADTTITQVDSTAAAFNAQITSIKADVIAKTKTETDKVIDEIIDEQIKNFGGGLGSVLLTDYGMESVSPLDSSTWAVAAVVYSDLSSVDLSVFETIVSTIDAYFGWFAWGVLLIVWGLGFFVWFMVYKKVKLFLAPFIVCPKCGNAFVTKRSAKGFLAILKPWNWF